MSQDDTEITQDDVFDILSSPRRRYILHFLRRHREPIELTELAEHVAAWENDTSREELERQERKRVYVSLYQTHVPKLDEAGFVRYDQDEGVVELAPESRAVERYLTEEADDTDWHVYYLALAVVAGVLSVPVVADVSVFAGVPDAVWVLLVVVSFLVTAVAQFVAQRREEGGSTLELRQR